MTNESYNFEYLPQPVEEVPSYLTWHGGLSIKECKAIVKLFEDNETEKAVINDNEYNPEIRDTGIYWIPQTDENHWIYEKVIKLGKMINEKFFHYDLVWEARNNPMSILRYQEGQHFDWHLDKFETGFHSDGIRKLTLATQINDPTEYEGGECEVWHEPTPSEAPKEISMTSIFDSRMLHRVKPVTKGVRYSLIYWFIGPSWR